MKVTLYIDPKQSTEIKPSDLATIIGYLPDDLTHAIYLPDCVITRQAKFAVP